MKERREGGGGRERERAKYLKGKGRNDRDPGGTGIFSSRCIDARKNGVKAPLSLPSATTPRTTSIPLPPSPTTARSRWVQSGEKVERGASNGGRGGEQKRADSRGRETFRSLVASLLACLTCLLVPSLACLLAACQVTVPKPAHATPNGIRTIVTVWNLPGYQSDRFLFRYNNELYSQRICQKWSENSKGDATIILRNSNISSIRFSNTLLGVKWVHVYIFQREKKNS